MLRDDAEFTSRSFRFAHSGVDCYAVLVRGERVLCAELARSGCVIEYNGVRGDAFCISFRSA
jgi:hypothetical protein